MDIGSPIAGFTAPIHALPLDVFRVLAGAVGLWYFARVLRQGGDFTAPDGLIDHRLSLRLFPPTRIGLFQPGLPAGVMQAAQLCAAVAAVGVIVGWQVRACAALLFLVAVSTYRWNLLVVYVDDAIMHLVFLWLIILPVGQTLDLLTLLTEGAGALERWTAVTVPGAATRCFMANLCLVYVVSGAYKFTSPMWLEGTALHAILKMPIALTPDFWGRRHAAVLKAVCHATLALEPLFALIFVLPAWSLPKWALLLAAAGFHLGIIVTLKIPLANAAMLGGLPLAAAPELMSLLGAAPLDPVRGTSLGAGDRFALGLVLALALMVIWEIARTGWIARLPLWRTHMSGFLGNWIYVGLWLIGVAQSYRLFDWVDRRNYHASYELLRVRRDGLGMQRLDPYELFPQSLRHLLLQSYLIGNVWLQIEPRQLALLRGSLLERHAQRYARRHPDAGTLEAWAVIQRVTSDNLELRRGERRLLMRFSCSGGEVFLHDETPPEAEVPCAAS
jgi:hypothetical protein